MSQSPSVTVHYAQGILQAAERLGLRLAPALGATDGARVPLARQDELWEALCVASGDALVGLRLGSALQVGHLDMLGALLMSCETLGEALEELLEYYPIIGEGSEFVLRQTADTVVLRYLPGYRVRRIERSEAVLASLARLSAWITGGRAAPRRVQMAHGARGEVQRYVELLGLPVDFQAPASGLVFAAEDLQTPLIQANGPMREHLRQLADEQLRRLGAQSLAAQVRQLLQAHPQWGKERVAEQLNLSGRHLNRKLAEEGSSFKLLREQVLYTSAERLLRESLRLAEVAERLGFSDESAFAKAFRRWSGTSPGQFRQGG